jgi:hypothetical protein
VQWQQPGSHKAPTMTHEQLKADFIGDLVSNYLLVFLHQDKVALAPFSLFTNPFVPAPSDSFHQVTTQFNTQT